MSMFNSKKIKGIYVFLRHPCFFLEFILSC